MLNPKHLDEVRAWVREWFPSEPPSNQDQLTWSLLRRAERLAQRGVKQGWNPQQAWAAAKAAVLA